MKACKRDFKTKQYSDYTLPPQASCYADDMGRVIQCASCGKFLEFGQGYTSRQIHTQLGFGYIVCPDCYKKEWQEADAASREEDQNLKNDHTEKVLEAVLPEILPDDEFARIQDCRSASDATWVDFVRLSLIFLVSAMADPAETAEFLQSKALDGEEDQRG